MIKLTDREREFVQSVKSRVSKGGSFVLSTNNKVYHGVPYEALNWIHGEQNAIGSMLTEEGPTAKFKLILIADSSKKIVMPCGMCRAAIMRYGTKGVVVLCTNQSLSAIKKYTISELYPHPYQEKE